MSSSILISWTFPLALPKTAHLKLQSNPPPPPPHPPPHTVETPKEGKQKTANEKAREEKREIKNCTKEEEQRFQRERKR